MNEEIDSLEMALHESLKPIHPNPGFIHSLRERISKRSRTFVERPQIPVTALVIIGTGLVTGLIFLLMRRQIKS